jgi:hypothetical protein
MNRDAALCPVGSPSTLRRCVARADAPARDHCAFNLRGCCSAGRCAPWSAHMNRQRKASSQRVSSNVNTCPTPIEPIPDLSSVRSWLSKLVEETARQRLPGATWRTRGSQGDGVGAAGEPFGAGYHARRFALSNPHGPANGSATTGTRVMDSRSGPPRQGALRPIGALRASGYPLHASSPYLLWFAHFRHKDFRRAAEGNP